MEFAPVWMTKGEARKQALTEDTVAVLEKEGWKAEDAPKPGKPKADKGEGK